MSIYKKYKNESLDEKRERRSDAFLDELLGGIDDDERFIDYDFSLSLEAKLPFTNEPSRYLNWIHGTIKYFGDELEGDAYDDGQICGQLTAFLVNFEQAMSNGVSRLYILDSLDDEFVECAELFNFRRRSGTYLTKAAQDVLTSQFSDFFTLYENFVYVKRLEITATHRGKRLGTYFLRQSLDYLAQTLPIDFFAMKPFPLQKEDNDYANNDEWQISLELNNLEKDWNKALLKLRDLYSELGFDLVKGTNLMICSADVYK